MAPVIGAVWAEGPHLYRRGDWYYLLASEGGTETFHALSVARSRSVTGPFEGYRGNPVLTHRHLGRRLAWPTSGTRISVERPDGSWAAVLLATRPDGSGDARLGEETFA
nr:Glyco_hydro_43 [uncultured Clostridium sp.]